MGKTDRKKVKALMLRYPSATCFVCECGLTEHNITDEHVIPSWLQRRLNLWDSLYDTYRERAIRYDRLRVPCCLSCNQRLNTYVEQPVLQMFEGSADINEVDLAPWLLKLNYGFAYFDQSQPLDPRRGMAAGHLAEAYDMDGFGLERAILQRVGRRRVRLSPAEHSSVFVFETQRSPTTVKEDFDYVDDPLSGFVSIRLGRIGVVAFMLDGGLVRRLPCAEYYRRAEAAQPLNPHQFRELAAFGKAIAASLSSTPCSFRVSEDLGVGSTSISFSRPWEAEALAGPSFHDFVLVLAKVWNRSLREVVDGASALTSIYDEDGKPYHLAFYDEVAMERPGRLPDHISDLSRFI